MMLTTVSVTPGGVLSQEIGAQVQWSPSNQELYLWEKYGIVGEIYRI